MSWYQFIPFNDVTVNLIIFLGGYLVFTRRLIWHKDYERVIREKDEWKALALRLLGATEKLTSQQEIVTHVVVDDDGAHK